MPRPSQAEFANLVQAAVLAPSADNRHQFVLRPTDEGVALHGGEAYGSAPFHRRILDRITLGAVLENVVVRAARLGYRAEVEWAAEADASSPVARVALQSGESTLATLDDAIAARHTNRRVLLSGPRLADGDLASFVQLAGDIPGASLFFADAPGQRGALLGLVRRAETERFAVRSLHDDLFSAVRFDVGWDKSADDGLPPAALGVEPGVRWAFALLRHWPVMKALKFVGMHHFLGLRAASLPCRLAPHCGVLTTTLAPEPGSLAVGRALQRVWLEAARRGLAFQPLAGAALLALPGYEAVRAATGQRLRQDWKALTAETPLMVFRMGHAAPASVRSGRPHWERFAGA